MTQRLALAAACLALAGLAVPACGKLGPPVRSLPAPDPAALEPAAPPRTDPPTDREEEP